MEIDPACVAAHLRKVHFPSIPTVVLRDQFIVIAQNHDHNLLVATPPLEGVEPLPDEVGVNLRHLIFTLRQLKFTSVSVTPGRLLLEKPTKPHEGTVSLVRLRPEAVESRVEPALAEEMFAECAGAPGMPLASLSAAEQWAEQWPEADQKYFPEPPPGEPVSPVVVTAATGVEADSVVLEVGPEGGQFVLSGKDFMWLMKMPHRLRTAEAYTLTFDVHPLVDVIKKLGRASGACIHLGGPRKPVLFTTADGFRYLVVPREAWRTLSSA